MFPEPNPAEVWVKNLAMSALSSLTFFTKILTKYLQLLILDGSLDKYITQYYFLSHTTINNNKEFSLEPHQ